jgi:hypothetical protein
MSTLTKCLIAIVCVGVVGAIAVSALIRTGVVGSVQSMNHRFLLTPADLAVLSQKAEAGDGDAAMKVFDHYTFGRNEYLKGVPFLKLAYAAGNPRSRSFMESYWAKFGKTDTKSEPRQNE